MGLIAMQAAGLLGVSTRTLAVWADKGRLKATRTAGRWRIYAWEDVKRLKKELAGSK